MEKTDINFFNQRINLNTDLKNISLEICKQFKLGNFISNKLITIGYEDYTYKLITSKGMFCVKILNKDRTKDEIESYLERIDIISKSSINSPSLLYLNDKPFLHLNYNQNVYNVCVFDFIEGKSLFEANCDINDYLIKEIAYQTGKINNLNKKPKFTYDSWSIINFLEEYDKKSKYLSDYNSKMIGNMVDEFKKIDFNKLPKGFVHGDIIKTNVMIDKNNKLWIIDFAVSNYLPRIIDLAVISSSICLDKNSKEKTYDNITLLLKEYDKYNNLTNYEFDSFYCFYMIANAMHILQAEYLTKAKGFSEQNEYWINEGMTGMAFGDKKKFIKLIDNLRH